MKKCTALLLSVCMVLTLFAGCASNAPAATTAAPTEAAAETTAEVAVDTSVTVTDMMGREITLDEPATRIVALTPSDCEILYAIGAGDTLVGRGEYCDYPAEVMDIPSVQSGSDTNIEQIIALEPQVLLMSTMGQTEEQIAQLEAAGIQVVVSDAKDIAGVYTAVEMIGALMNKSDEAAAVVDNMKAVFADVAQQAAGKEAQNRLL